jgi:hypothetical protein
MTPKIWASIEAIQAIIHQFAQHQTAIRWLEWLHRKLSIVELVNLNILHLVNATKNMGEKATYYRLNTRD